MQVVHCMYPSLASIYLVKLNNRNTRTISADNYMFKINNKNTRTKCEICSKVTIKTPERRRRRRSAVFIVNFAHISHLVFIEHSSHTVLVFP